jgi:hypothetical protein
MNSAGGVVVVYENNNRNSFNSARDWLVQVNQMRQQNCAVMLVGIQREVNGGVSVEEARTAASAQHAMFFEVSLADSNQILNAFAQFAHQFILKQEQ